MNRFVAKNRIIRLQVLFFIRICASEFYSNLFPSSCLCFDVLINFIPFNAQFKKGKKLHEKNEVKCSAVKNLLLNNKALDFSACNINNISESIVLA